MCVLLLYYLVQLYVFPRAYTATPHQRTVTKGAGRQTSILIRLPYIRVLYNYYIYKPQDEDIDTASIPKSYLATTSLSLMLHEVYNSINAM